MPIAPEQMLPLLQTMLLMRRTEEAVCDLADEFPGNFHVYIGQEATGAAVLSQLRREDPVITTHRNHAHNVARGMAPAQVLAEILGRGSGSSGGKGGTFHVMSAEFNTVATAIVGGSTILATGSALAAQVLGDERIGVAFLGDRTLNEGAVYESFNLASLWSLPVLYVCENNNAIPYDPRSSGLTVKELVDVPRAFGIATAVCDGTDPDAVYDTVARAIDEVRSQRHPFFLEVRTPKWPGNAGADPSLEITGRTDVSLGWAPLADDPQAAWRQADPVLRLVARGLADGTLEPADVDLVDEEVQGRLRGAVEVARGAAMPDGESATLHALAGDGLWPPVRAW